MFVQWAAFVLILLYFLLDTFLRKGSSAKLPKTEFDRKTTLMIVLAMGTTVVAAELLSYFGIGRFNAPVIAWSGLALMGVGFLIRVASILQLKEAYTRTLKVEADQQLITSGMYRSI